MDELALFSGAGGGILGGVLLGWRCVGAVEIDAYCREVLLRRQEEGFLAPFPVWDDIRDFDGKPWRGAVDIVTAGFPCQPWSVAGKRRGKDDERNLWPDTIRVIREVGPRWALLENVPGLVRTRYFGAVLGDLAEAGYDAEWDVISAGECGAPHRRERLWILAHAQGRLSGLKAEHEGREDPGGGSQEEPVSNTFGHDIREQSRRREGKGGTCAVEPWGDGEAGHVAHAGCLERQAGAAKAGRQKRQGAGEHSEWWATEPEVGRVAHGVAHRVDQLRALGNGQVARVAVEAWCRLSARFASGAGEAKGT